MTAPAMVEILREAMAVVALLSGPPVGLALIVGLIGAVLQTLTQVQDPVLGYAPKAAAVFGVLVVAGPGLAGLLVGFARACFEAGLLGTRP